MNTESFLSKRLFSSGRGQARPSRLTIVATIGIGAGVMALIIVLSVMGGFERSFQTNMLVLKPHVEVRVSETTQGSLSRLEQALTNSKLSWSHLSEGPAMAVKGHQVSTVTFMGVDGAALERLGSRIVLGKPLTPQTQGIILGKQLALDLGVEEGDFVELLNPFEKDALFLPLPMTRRFNIVGIADTGIAEWDHGGAWAPTDRVNEFFGFTTSHIRIGLWNTDLNQTDELLKKTKEAVNESQLQTNTTIQTWRELNQTIFQSMQLEQRSMFVLLLVVIAVASLNITILLSMTVNEKKTSIGTLLTLGMTPRRIARVFLLYGLRIGLIGTCAGAALGCGIVIFLKHATFIRIPDVYYDQTLPVLLRPGWVVSVMFSTLLIAFSTAVLPAKRASQLSPIDCLRTGR